MSSRVRASSLHLLISLCVAGLTAAIVFLLWYPYPYSEISGGRELFLILVSVDVVLGPVLTFVVFNSNKSFRELFVDLMIVALFQVTALGYGLWTVACARPVHIVFEIDRFRVVHAVDIPDELLAQVPNGIIALPWTGPSALSIRKFKDAQESSEMTLAALQGLNLAYRPELWQSYELGVKDIKSIGKSLALVRKKFPQYENIFSQIERNGEFPLEELIALPVVARNTFWTVFVHSKTGDIITILPIDVFE